MTGNEAKGGVVERVVEKVEETPSLELLSRPFPSFLVFSREAGVVAAETKAFLRRTFLSRQRYTLVSPSLLFAFLAQNMADSSSFSPRSFDEEVPVTKRLRLSTENVIGCSADSDLDCKDEQVKLKRTNKGKASFPLFLPFFSILQPIREQPYF